MATSFDNEGNHRLKEKPFFVARIADLVLSGERFSQSNLVDQLVVRYIERERTEKLLDRNSAPLLTFSQISELLREFAVEMWSQSTRVLEIEDIRILTQIYAEEKALEPSTAVIIAERAPFMAFFTVGPEQRRIRFEHDIFFSYFLSDVIIDQLLSDVNHVFGFLARGQLPEFASDFVGQRVMKLLASGDLKLSECVDKLSEASGIKSSQSLQVRENSGNLLASVLRNASSVDTRSISGLSFRDLIFAGSSFAEVVAEDCSFFSVLFNSSDFSLAQFKNCRIDQQTMFEDVIVDPNWTLFDFRPIDPKNHVFALRIIDGNSYRRIFRPDIVSGILKDCGAIIPGTDEKQNIDNDIILLMEQLMMKLERTNMFWPDDAPNRLIVNNSKWRDLRDRLIKFDIVSIDEQRSVSKQPREALRRNYLPQQIMWGLSHFRDADPNIAAFWSSWRNQDREQ